ncbi:substrate-binding periplasmic protein [Planctobacterium marinum]|uniref:substrate-binding periplasmic protein n=1 Tax=Planctobacterium marinum TaxID=1631968 RepID=UPI003CC82A22
MALVFILLLSLMTSRALSVEVVIEKEGKPVVFEGFKRADGAWIFNPDAQKVIKMATLDWMPYIGENVCGQGWVQQLVVGAFLQLGYQVQSHFVPWKRAVLMAESGHVDVLYPEYAIAPNAPSDIFPHKNRDELLVLSEPFSGGNVALIKRTDHEFDFNGDLLSLKAQTIGVVAGYENSPEFDALMEEGYFYISPSVDDWINIKKLHKGRINFIVADPLVVNYTVAQNMTEVEEAAFKNATEVLQPYLAVQPLYLAFSKARPEYRTHLQAFNHLIVQWRESGRMKAIRDHWIGRATEERTCVSRPVNTQ